MAEPSDLTPFEWLARLGRKIQDRRPQIDRWRRYYTGEQDLPSGPSQQKDAYRRFQKKARTNLCLLCAESMVHRTNAIGFRESNGNDDNAVWKLWQDSKLDARQFGLWRKAYSRSAAYAIVGVDPRNTTKPRVTIEGPETVIVETDPADSARRIAALRLWHDEIAQRWLATLYLPGEREGLPGQRFHWRTKSERRRAGEGLSFNPQFWETRADPARSLPDVPVIPFLNGDEGEDPTAEFAVGMDVQDRLNLTLLNRLTAERFGAFRQRFMLNYEPEEDAETGLPISPFNLGHDQLLTAPPPEPGNPEIKMGDFAQTDTSGMLRGVEADMRAFAAVTLTPVYYLPGDLINISADSVAALDAGHVAKVRQREAQWGESLEELLQLMSDIAGLGRDLGDSEIVWAKPEAVNPAAIADYASKLVAAQIPVTMVAEEIGWSPQRVKELRTEQAANALRASLTAAPTAPRPPAVGNGQAPPKPVTPAKPATPAPAPKPPVNPPTTP